MPSTPPAGTTPGRQVAAFIARFDPAIASVARSARATLRQRMPTAIEIVYDNDNVLVLGFSSAERPSDSIVAIAVYPGRINRAQTMRTLLGGGRPSARRDQLRPVSADT